MLPLSCRVQPMCLEKNLPGKWILVEVDLTKVFFVVAVEGDADRLALQWI